MDYPDFPRDVPDDEPVTPIDDGRRGTLVAPLVVFALAILLHAMGLGELTHILIGGTLHEMGHTGAAILGGRWAFFVPFAFTFSGEEWSPLVLAGMLGGLGWLGNRCVQERLWFTAAVCAALLVVQVKLSLLTPVDDWKMWMVFFGCGGEIVIAALLVMAFFHRLPARLRWDFWRYPVLLVGALAFYEAFLFWRQVDPELRALLGGDSIAASRENDQDMVRLVRNWHWSPEQLLAAYRRLCAVGALGILAHYAVFGAAALWPRRAPAASRDPL